MLVLGISAVMHFIVSTNGFCGHVFEQTKDKVQFRTTDSFSHGSEMVNICPKVVDSEVYYSAFYIILHLS